MWFHTDGCSDVLVSVYPVATLTGKQLQLSVSPEKQLLLVLVAHLVETADQLVLIGVGLEVDLAVVVVVVDGDGFVVVEVVVLVLLLGLVVATKSHVSSWGSHPQKHPGSSRVRQPFTLVVPSVTTNADSDKGRRPERAPMPEDASLDEFLGGDGEEADVESGDSDTQSASSDDAANGDRETAGRAEQGDTETGAPETGGGATDDPDTDDEIDDEGVSPETVEPATATAAWSPDGESCAACGTVVAYRWQGEPGLVCPDCKEW